ncbi:MAG: metal-dependent hydrolase [Bacteroidetes bacterium]|nr:metal-dependent hydrolase [Bacteroidota bacterium]
MASVFGHAAAAYAIGKTYPERLSTWKMLGLGILCAILPDADVIGFRFGVEYGSFWGHRGFTHSFLFAALNGLFFTGLFYRKTLWTRTSLWLFIYFFLCTASHPVLDAMTTGGKGVAFFSPWDNSRYFLPWRPIKVSPLGIDRFFSKWGLQVLWSEVKWIGIPGLLLVLVVRGTKAIINRKRPPKE